MHTEVLTKEQRELLPLIKLFSKDYYLVGGTAIALLIGHRKSIDYDLFTYGRVKRKSIKYVIEKNNFSTDKVIWEDFEQLHLKVNSVKMTFFKFPHKLNNFIDFNGIIKIPHLLDLSAMKAYALGGRANWKDYVDLYFLMKTHFNVVEISNRAKELFEGWFNEKLFREQLSYFDDVDYRERIEFIGKEIPEDEIKDFLIKSATIPF
ncbi:MAG: hypothetical protein CVT90_00685 [Candidatus Altiarchaeales archaeon HGW-Altiarchaeales-3]|nr:MAG: hypothetical protein CVT90_00685 [Candidatus Altiarchaeales archaeon HGW-Altiarchaeales-3]